jgi:hypothetical protein
MTQKPIIRISDKKKYKKRFKIKKDSKRHMISYR